MELRCIAADGAALDAPGVDSIDSWRGLWFSRETTFPVTVDGRYAVFGMGVWNGSPTVLIADDFRRPTWLPALLFEESTEVLPPHWEVTFPNGGRADPAPRGWQALWGYSRLVRSAAHRDGLADGDPIEVRRFFAESGIAGGQAPRDSDESQTLSVRASELRAAFERLMSAVDDVVEIDAAVYWDVLLSDAFGMEVEPSVAVGAVSDDVESVRELISRSPEDVVLWHDLTHFTGVLRAVASRDLPGHGVNE